MWNIWSSTSIVMHCLFTLLPSNTQKVFEGGSTEEASKAKQSEGSRSTWNEKWWHSYRMHCYCRAIYRDRVMYIFVWNYFVILNLHIHDLLNSSGAPLSFPSRERVIYVSSIFLCLHSITILFGYVTRISLRPCFTYLEWTKMMKLSLPPQTYRSSSLRLILLSLKQA